MTIGLSMLAAQYWGKNDRTSVEKIFAYVMKITAVVSFSFFIVSLLIPNLLMLLFTNDKDLIEGGTIYLKTVSISFFLTGISQIYLCILKNSGKAVKAGIISSVSVIINIFLNAVFIFGLFGMPKLEIAGAALATVISRLIEIIWCVSGSVKKDSVHLKLIYVIHNDVPLKKDFWKYTLPVLGNEIVCGVGFTMYSVIMGHLGTDAVAANSIANIIKNLIVCFCIGISTGGGIIIGNELGAGRLDTAKEYGRKLCRLSVILGIISGIVMFMLSPIILKFSNLSDTANDYLKWMTVMCSAYMVGKSVNMTIIDGIFCAGGDSKFGLLCDCITMWCITVPLGFIAAFALKLPALAAVSLSFPITTLMNALSVWIGVGVNVLIAGYLGQNKTEKANSAATLGLLLSVIVGTAVNIAVLFIIKPYYAAFTQNSEIFEYGLTYMKICAFMQLPNMVHIAIQKMLQAIGNMITPMWFQIAGVIFNFIFDPLLIFGIGPFPEMGIAGAALATVLGYTLSMLIALIQLFFTKQKVRPMLKGYHFELQMLGQLISYGLPSFIMNALY